MNKKSQDNNIALMTSWSESEYSRILTAAVVNRRFREMLLTNPDIAINNGYAGEVFHLGNEEKKRLSAIRATSLADFARQLTQPQTALMGCAAD